MTDSITRSSTSWIKALWALLLLWGLGIGGAVGAEIDIKNPQLVVSEDGVALSADFTIEFNSRLEDAVTRGVVLYFVTDFELTRPRWYWFDERALTKSQSFQLSYHALTRQYRLSSGALHQSFPSLAAALKVLSRLRNWTVIEKGAERTPFKAGEAYQAALRIRLDISQLPKPFQLSALADKDWTLSSDWLRWQATIPAEPK